MLVKYLLNWFTIFFLSVQQFPSDVIHLSFIFVFLFLDFKTSLIVLHVFLQSFLNISKKVKVWFYIALYPVRWTAQSALHFPPLADLFIPTPFSASLGRILAMQQLRNDYSHTFAQLSIARYSFIQLSRLRRREVVFRHDESRPLQLQLLNG